MISGEDRPKFVLEGKLQIRIQEMFVRQMILEIKKGTEGEGKTIVGLICQIEMVKDAFSCVCITCRN